ncbi:MAG: CotH kinase family protein, partial [Bacteroidales bacterium]|nr:CotH kinase family protein [Bacteroidales bacterium]
LQALVNRSLDLDLQAYQPVITYFNGQYWGIMNIREKVDEDYFLGNFNITDDSIDFMEGNLMSDPGYHYSAIRGSKVDFLNLIDFVTSNSLVNDDNYHAVVSQLDLQEYLNYMAVQIYIANTDWPGNNLKFWKRSPYGKWRWILFDTDFGFGATSYDHRTIEFATATEEVSWPNPPWSTLLFRKLLENDSFQKAFIRTLLTIRNTCFQPDWCNFVMDSLSSRIDYEMTYHKAKYGGSKTDWNNSLSRLKHFAANRYGFIPDYISSYFGLGGEKVNFSVENPHHTHGDVLVNESVIRNYPFSMQTFRDIALSLEAIPAKGYNFKHWKYADHTLTNTILPLGSEWSYLDVATDYPANWTTASFDDSSWKNGQGQLGYGDGDEATVISFGPDQNNKITTALFRKKFIMPDTAGISDIEMELQMDDGAVVYLNGQEIFRSNMPAGVIGFNTYASEPNDQVVVYTGVDKEAFVSGENVIACEMHQCNGTSSDLGFDISLTYTSVEESTGDIFSYEAFIQSDTSFNIALEPVFESIDAIQGVHLNEIAPVTRNFRDEYDEKSGFVELYNNNGEDMTLFSFFISDDAGNLMRYAIPDSTVIPADGFITFYLDGEAKQGSYHTNFKADPDGESMYLSQKVGETITILDSVSFELLVADHSFGKYTDGTGNWQYMVNMTPGLPNDPEVLNCSEEYRTFTTYVRIYPNPSRGNVFISIEEDDIHTHVYSINIIDICGKVVYPKIWLNSNSSSVNLTNLSRGLYFVRLYKDHQPVNTSKLILLE